MQYLNAKHFLQVDGFSNIIVRFIMSRN